MNLNEKFVITINRELGSGGRTVGRKLAEDYPQYDWRQNKGYPTKKHREAIRQFGTTPYHRMSYNLLGDGQLSLDFKD